MLQRESCSNSPKEVQIGYDKEQLVNYHILLYKYMLVQNLATLIVVLSSRHYTKQQTGQVVIDDNVHGTGTARELTT